MRRFFKKYHILPFLVALLFFTIPLTAVVVHAQANKSISGDDICGSSAATKCTLSSLGVVAKNVFKAIVVLGSPALLVFASWRILVGWYKLRSGSAADWKDTRKELTNAVGGFLLIVALFGGLLTAMLKLFGVKDSVLHILNVFSSGFITHAYAQTAATSPFNVTNSSDVYDFLLSFFRVVIRFILYPGIIAMWVWSGFSFVLAQGNPDALAKSRKLLLSAFLVTIAIFMFQTFLTAIQGTVQKVLPGSAAVVKEEPTTGGKDTRIAPKEGEAGAPCDLGGGAIGQIGTDLKCNPSGRGSNTGPVTSCGSGATAQKSGTPCKISGSTLIGACGMSETNVYGCYKSASPVASCTGVPDGTPCTLPSGKEGACGTSSESETRSCYVIVE